MSARADSGQGPWQIKKVKSSTGPVGWALSDACRRPYNVTGQTEVLWISTGNRNDKQIFDQVYNPYEDKGTHPNNRNSGSSKGML